MVERKLYIIIVTHNSKNELPECLKCLAEDSIKHSFVLVVDSGSSDRGYLKDLAADFGFELLETENRGFAAANNIGFKRVLEKGAAPSDIIVFLNPDTFVKPGWAKHLTKVFEDNVEAGAVTGKLMGYDLENKKPTGKFDSTGIFRKWYGRWYDRGQGEKDLSQYNKDQLVPAICGALFCCQVQSLIDSMVADHCVFDEDFFLYKEDIELSLRLRKNGWDLHYHPDIEAYHCRGWNESRASVSYEKRLMSAGNELLLYKKHFSPYLFWAFLKYLLVRFFHF